eukprot:TRINITY_DN79948_c0_g1_i1.p1 TRINITY_DN79948_c0_g1~~TRINITY_DN79948_c0_g1_i1.p1  ORF type:complete len:250 (+),score=50.89 TRINITY_DN79948_c0_g1_i1:38-787(+)
MAAAAVANPGSSCPYLTLGLIPGASHEEVRSAFRRAVLRTHPDKAGGSAEAFGAVQQAYESIAAAEASGCAGAWADAQGQQSKTSFDPWGMSRTPASDFDSWSSAASFDPWSSASFDPWSSSSFDPWGAGAADPDTVRDAVFQSSAGATVQEEEADRLTKRRRKGPSGRSAAPDGDSEAQGLTRYGVYGFRPSSSESGDEAPPPAARTGRPKRRQAKFRCSIHQRLRFEDCLMDDGSGKPVCKPGRECP